MHVERDSGVDRPANDCDGRRTRGNGAIIYRPRIGRFMQPDPIGYGDGMNPYGYVGGDPVNSADPSGTDTVCVAPIGSHIRSQCIKVDGNLNGVVNENDLTSRQERRIEAAFGGFISHYGNPSGLDIHSYGKTILGSLPYDERNMVGIVSQFVGAAIRFSGSTSLSSIWGEIPFIVAKKELQSPGNQTAGSSCHLQGCGMLANARSLTIYGGNGDTNLQNFYDSPSDLGRIILHEVFHGTYPFVSGPDPRHFELDRRARMFLIRMGLGGERCLAISGFPRC